MKYGVFWGFIGEIERYNFKEFDYEVYFVLRLENWVFISFRICIFRRLGLRLR